ncbi:recombinase family protein [Rathayibacter sp. AY1D1]|uniref:recombinase family protein n=1 Tax=Rathayibacter sp. AY1D1 TaxID=2080542 RepID=UPI000CE7D227|nr:recombinase family protein [Rathayibacter sp. AY1D1]PPI00630.1 recombinase family protein [Rathayibacter sp. AY1D1]
MIASTVKAAVYLRISQDANADGLAVDRQRGECLALAEARGWTVTEEFSDTVSASKRAVARPAYDSMFAAFEAGRFDALVVWDLDRLTRQPRQLEDWIELAETRSVLIVTASGEADLTTDNGRLFARIKASVARAEIERKGARQRAKNVQNIAQGRPVPGRRRYGYESGNLTPREPEAQDVRDLFTSALAGASLRSLSVARGRRTRWVREVLSNKAYAGWVQHQGVYSPGVVTPLVSLEEWERVQLLLTDPTRKTTPGPTPRHLMSGLASCGVCGAHLFYMRGYLCSAAADHVHITKALLDTAVSDEVFMWAVSTDSTQTDSAALTDLLREHADVERRREAAQDLFLLPGANRASVARTLASLGKESERITRLIDQERARESVSDILGAVRGAWWDRRFEREYTEQEEAAVSAWPEFWASLGLDRQREVVRSLFSVRVDKGRGPERVSIEHV